MSDEKNNHPEEEPQLFSVKKSDNGGWQFSRRDFIKGAGAALTMLITGKTFDNLAQETPTPIPESGYAHDARVSQVIISPDGQYLISTALGDNYVKVWSMPDGQLYQSLEGYFDFLLSEDGSILVISGESGTQLMSFPELTLLKTLIPDGDSLHIFPKSPKQRFANLTNTNITVWSIPDGELLYQFDSRGAWFGVMSEDENYLAILDSNNLITIWSLIDGTSQQIHADAEPPIYSLQISSDNAFLITAGGGQFIHIWSIASETLYRTLDNEENDYSFKMLPDGKFLISQSGNIWSIPDGQFIQNIGIVANTVGFSPDGLIVMIFENLYDAPNFGNTFSIALFSLPNWKLINQWEANQHLMRVLAIAISPDNKWGVTGSHDKTIKIWSLSDGLYVRDLIDTSLD